MRAPLSGAGAAPTDDPVGAMHFGPRDGITEGSPIGHEPDAPLECRPRLPAPLAVPPSWTFVHASALADALGNGDGAVTDSEGEVERALEAIPLGARCWLGASVGSALAVRERVSAGDILVAACGLDCGDTRRGVPSDRAPLFGEAGCAYAVPLVRSTQGFTVGRVALGPAGPRPLTPLESAPARPRILPPMARVSDALSPDSAACRASVTIAAAKWQLALDAGGCPLERLARSARHGAPLDATACDWPLFAVDYEGARRCDTGSPQVAAPLYALFADGGVAGRYLDVRALLRAAGLHGSSFDATRVIAAARTLQRQGPLTHHQRVALMRALLRRPLGLSDAEIDALLDAGIPPDDETDRALVRLAQQGRLDRLPRSAARLSARQRGWLTRQLSPACGDAIRRYLGR